MWELGSSGLNPDSGTNMMDNQYQSNDKKKLAYEISAENQCY